MARRGMTGQLNMFDLFRSLDENPGEVEMVSLVPSFEERIVEEVPEMVEKPAVIEEAEVAEKPVVIEEPELVIAEEKSLVKAATVMTRCYKKAGKKIEIAYLNYNKVRIQEGDAEPVIMEFDTTKDAVDYYVEKMQELEKDE